MPESGQRIFNKHWKGGLSGRSIVRISRSARETAELGGLLAAHLDGGDCVLVSGPLGAGKTVLVRGALRKLGVRDSVCSPTFTLAHEASGKSPTGRRLRIAHLDFYRLTVPAAERGLLDYLDGKFMVFVEWPERDRSFWPRRPIRVRISILPRGRRSVRIAFPAPVGNAK